MNPDDLVISRYECECEEQTSAVDTPLESESTSENRDDDHI